MGLMDCCSLVIINCFSLLNMYSLKACPTSKHNLPL